MRVQWLPLCQLRQRDLCGRGSYCQRQPCLPTATSSLPVHLERVQERVEGTLTGEERIKPKTEDTKCVIHVNGIPRKLTEHGAENTREVIKAPMGGAEGWTRDKVHRRLWQMADSLKSHMA